MSVNSTEFDTRIKGLRLRFVERLVRDEVELTELLHATFPINRPCDVGALISRIRLIAHKLHGAAAPFGFGAVGAAAARVEQAADMVFVSVQPKEPRILSDLENELYTATQLLIDCLRNELRSFA